MKKFIISLELILMHFLILLKEVSSYQFLFEHFCYKIVLISAFKKTFQPFSSCCHNTIIHLYISYEFS